MRRRAALLIGISLLTGGLFQGISYLNGKLSALLPPGHALQPRRLQKNDHTLQNRVLKGPDYHYTLRFRDHQGREWTWGWRWDKARLDQEIARYGIPASMFQGYRIPRDPVERRRIEASREKTMQDGFFVQDGRVLRPDYNRLAQASMPFTLPLFHLLQHSTPQDSARERLNLALKLVQDLPYAIPPDRDGEKFIGGMLSPAQSLHEMWGDCDTKSLLLASLLAHDPRYKLALVGVPNHMFLAVEGIPRPYEFSLTFQGKQYLALEAAGPGRTPIGETYEKYRTITEVYPLRFSPSADTEATTGAALMAEQTFEGGVHILDQEQVGEGEVRLTVLVKKGFFILPVLEQQGKEYEQRVFASPLDEELFEVRVRFPQPGDYQLRIYTKKGSSSGRYKDSMETNLSSEHAAPQRFPETFSEYQKVGISLLEPLSYSLPLGKTVTFRVANPQGRVVFVGYGSEKTVLQPSEDGTYAASVQLNHKGELVVYAEESSSRNPGLVAYRVETSHAESQLNAEQAQTAEQAREASAKFDAIAQAAGLEITEGRRKQKTTEFKVQGEKGTRMSFTLKDESGNRTGRASFGRSGDGRYKGWVEVPKPGGYTLEIQKRVPGKTPEVVALPLVFE